ncbi:uncharacterized protein SOCE26_073640 [Sorangium cellulosum]|uniref:Uncharacterized protein n=1 Tax=Sorangium cellulosum TaxID=56 RepID=A0A2L0F2R0_SORCE|nr:uncharacterized protein SOCE26_073640 [Sorangium cellulosum]
MWGEIHVISRRLCCRADGLGGRAMLMDPESPWDRRAPEVLHQVEPDGPVGSSWSFTARPDDPDRPGLGGARKAAPHRGRQHQVARDDRSWAAARREPSMHGSIIEISSLFQEGERIWVL